jgi:hypothetical protein
MPSETCEYHTLLVADIAVIKNSLANIEKKMCSHVEDGEKQGGFRDRLIIAEQEISIIKKGYWKACLISGLIGGLVGNVSPDIITSIAKLVGIIK